MVLLSISLVLVVVAIHLSFVLVLLLLIVLFVLLAPLPVPDIDNLIFVLVDTQPFLLVVHKLAVIDIALGPPLESQSVLAAFIKVFSLPSAEIPLSIKMPNEADIS